MTLKVTAADWRKIFPRAPQTVIDAFASDAGTAALRDAGILETRTRLAYAAANVEHECGGFTIPNLTESLNYTPERMAQVWPSRFPGGASSVRAKYGAGAGWQKRAMDDIYGRRMGNRPNTTDGSTYIGRGGPQVTGRDGYDNVGKRVGLDLVNHPELAGSFGYQPQILAGFWSWKGLNKYADKGDFKGCVRAWNGGQIGLADRIAMMRGNDPIIARLQAAQSASTVVNNVPHDKADTEPPKEVVSEATKTERAAVAGSGASVAATGTAAATTGPTPLTKTTTTVEQPAPSSTSAWVHTGVNIGFFLCLILLVVFVIMWFRKVANVKQIWSGSVVLPSMPIPSPVAARSA